ncbi:hypothetical protein BX600DRAFT_153693 [Xylariales sp. PMI_506]|nr:hypothetical protein BX600DRAFT_153693 [Xylariales sp. PMI_506]
MKEICMELFILISTFVILLFDFTKALPYQTGGHPSPLRPTSQGSRADCATEGCQHISLIRIPTGSTGASDFSPVPAHSHMYHNTLHRYLR